MLVMYSFWSSSLIIYSSTPNSSLYFIYFFFFFTTQIFHFSFYPYISLSLSVLLNLFNPVLFACSLSITSILFLSFFLVANPTPIRHFSIIFMGITVSKLPRIQVDLRPDAKTYQRLGKIK